MSHESHFHSLVPYSKRAGYHRDHQANVFLYSGLGSTHSGSFVPSKPEELNEASARLASDYQPPENPGIWQRKAVTYSTFSLAFEMRTSSEREVTWQRERGSTMGTGG